MPPTILIVSDQIITTVWFKKHLKHKFHCIIENSEQNAIERLQATTVDLIIVDGRMGSSSFLVQIKKAVSPAWVPVLLITDNLKKAYRSKMIKAGASDFINEPLDENEVVGRITEALQTKERQKKIKELSSVLKENKKVSTTFADKFFLKPEVMRLIAESKEKKRPLATLFFRIDGYDALEKKVTPKKRELILLYVSDIILQLSGPSAILVPAKEGKFLLLIPDTTPEKAKEKAKQIQETLKKRPFKDTSGLIPLSISIALVQEDLPVDQIFAMADQALTKIEKTSQMISIRSTK
ncbi:MAG TPA: response regulator [Chlamydiales bacterium]|nr:response regulator [Chlamydiales bacterium]